MAKLDEQVIDKRIVERNIEKGLLTEEEHQSHLIGLPDLKDNAEKVKLFTDEEEQT